MAQSTKPLVSIISVAYNQKPYIAEALDSFLMQRTNFNFEVIIHDDASTDNTDKIIASYAEKHPAIIKPMFEKTNQYSRGRDSFINQMFRLAQGRYIAQCEGDDYWTDKDKLQTQVDFMEKNPNYGLCFHPVKVVFENKSADSYIYPEQKSGFSLAELLKRNYIQSNSTLYRAQNYEDLPLNISPRDWYLHLYHAQFGKVGFIDKIMSVYRRHSGGLWWETHTNVDRIWQKHGLAHLRMYNELMKIFGKNNTYQKIIQENINQAFKNIIGADRKYGGQSFLEAVSKFPEKAEAFAIDWHSEMINKDKKIEELNRDNQEKSVQLSAKEHEITLIKSSRVWKARNKAARIIGKEPI
jgi:glycosyltransferase involved in cell wall biosynthesis